MHDSKMAIPGPLFVPASKGRVGKKRRKMNGRGRREER